MKKTVGLIVLVVASACSVFCSTIIFDDNFEPLGIYYSYGLVDWDPGWTWNGQYVTPPAHYRVLSSEISLYTERTDSHTLFIQVHDVVSGNGAGFFGAAFWAITMTGIDVSGAQLPSVSPIFSGQYANPGEYLEGTYGGCSQSQNVPLITTPGWNLAVASPGAFTIQTTSTPTNGFTGPSGCIYGDYRIINGGVFALDFGESLDSVADGLSLSIIYGYHRQTIDATLVPEPGTVLMLSSGLLGTLMVSCRRLSR